MAYLGRLIERAFDVKKTIDIHREALLLYGMYVKRTDQMSNLALVKGLRDHYFPLKVRELIANSQQESNFRAILKAVNDMIKLSGRINLFEMVFPLFREELSDKWRKDLSLFVEGYLKEKRGRLDDFHT